MRDTHRFVDAPCSGVLEKMALKKWAGEPDLDPLTGIALAEGATS